MSPAAKDTDDTLPHPRGTTALFGHADAEQTLLGAYRSGRIPHAWLIGGPPGIGKATLAYRMARFVLAHPDPTGEAVLSATSLAVDAGDPAATRIAAQAHGNLLVLERAMGDNDKLKTVITVDQARETVSFFGSTAAEAGWRICVVDSVDELNVAAANALLKILEEPPPRALMLLISHAPGRVLATIRSRCRRLMLKPLTPGDVAQALGAALGRDQDDPDLQAAAEAGEGSVARAWMLLDEKAAGLRERIVGMLSQLPRLDARALHGLGDAMAGTDPEKLEVFADTVNAWLSGHLTEGPQDTARLARVANAWDIVNRAVRDVDSYNLERKPLVFSVFNELADVARD